MKIAHLTGTFSAFSGIDRVVALLSAEQVKQGHQVMIVTLDGDMAPPPGVELVKLGLPRRLLVQRLYRLLMFFDRAAIRRGAEAIREANEVYSHQYPMNLIAIEARKRFQSRYVYYDHGIPENSVFQNPIERIYISLFRWIANQTIRQCDQAISISHYLQDVLKDQTGIDSTVVPDTVNTQLFHPELDGRAIRERHHLNHDPVILFIGRISPHKGIHLLIQAFKRIRSELPSARLVIVGKQTFSAYARQLKNIADDHIVFAGYVPDDDLPGYYGAADVYATASLWEGFNLPLAEAQACGKPVVAFDLGPHPEVVTNGKLVAPRDVEALASSIQSYLTSSARA